MEDIKTWKVGNMGSLFLAGMLQGDLDNGIVLADNSISSIHSVKSVQAIFDDFKQPFINNK
ncbi:hypothetical protein [Ligilactobacillus acidipiscis]|uniref:hypothetical protein n=1 Tax=Ligilactobacillus acidipiscis TaxID=89059 RepID=UPI0023F7B909|nr:hypothetical protein [Ligilactobacillus acidipiscis]WEV57448.1 hypothetical protein OZX66_02570 [Ligilactobacillus acidipiscis]